MIVECTSRGVARFLDVGRNGVRGGRSEREQNSTAAYFLEADFCPESTGLRPDTYIQSYRYSGGTGCGVLHPTRKMQE